MKCEICHTAPAETVLKLKQDGVEKELYVCRNCAAQAAHPAAPANGKPGVPSKKSGSAHGVHRGASDTPPPPFVENFVKATLDFMQEAAAAEENDQRVCPSCGTPWEQIKNDGLIACPTCWKTFARLIREEFLSPQFGFAHIGKAPAIGKVKNARDARAILERDLQDAIAREDFHLAAALKKKLDALPGKGARKDKDTRPGNGDPA